MSFSNSSCDPLTTPDKFPSIPSNLAYKAIPGQNTSDPWMVACCQPYPVQLVDSCWEWCEISPETAHNKNLTEIADDFGLCLLDNDRISPNPRPTWFACRLPPCKDDDRRGWAACLSRWASQCW
jgi:hypothetical protein